MEKRQSQPTVSGRVAVGKMRAQTCSSHPSVKFCIGAFVTRPQEQRKRNSEPLMLFCKGEPARIAADWGWTISYQEARRASPAAGNNSNILSNIW
jgi:hypothetical protein